MTSPALVGLFRTLALGILLIVVRGTQANAEPTPEDLFLPQAPPAAITQSVPTPAAQPPAAYTPIDGPGRIDWIVGGTIGPRSLGIGVLAAAMQTGLNLPEEWHRSWDGAARRYLHREADVAISNTLEAGLGALWGEEPRYIRANVDGIWPRARYALKTVFLAQRRDGRLAPAWGRYVGNVANNVIENTWLPPSATTWQATTARSAGGFLGRAGGNLWEEFWPDVRRLLFK